MLFIGLKPFCCPRTQFWKSVECASCFPFRRGFQCGLDRGWPSVSGQHQAGNASLGPARRSGQWEFAGYHADGTYSTPPAKTAACAQCHRKAGAAKDFVFPLKPFDSAGKAR
jgi:hypothetical protein